MIAAITTNNKYTYLKHTGKQAHMHDIDSKYMRSSNYITYY